MITSTTRPPGEMAVFYAVDLGWNVFPVWWVNGTGTCACGKTEACTPGKHPLGDLVPHGLNDATATVETIRRWWQKYQYANIGIRTGRMSGVVAIDIDPRHGGDHVFEDLENELGELPETPEQITGGGGRHIVLKYPDGDFKFKKNLGAGVDIKADGGYIVAEPSNHESGGRYAWEMSSRPDEVEIAEIPAKWLAAMTKTEEETKSAPPVANTIEGGKRNRTLMSLAGSMRRRGMEEPEILPALAKINSRRCKPPLPDAEVAKVAANVCHYTPSDPVGSAASNPVPMGTDKVAKLLTDVGNAARFVHQHGDKVRYNYGPGRWLIWDGTRWKPDESGEVGLLGEATVLSISDEVKDAEGDEQEKLVKHWEYSQSRTRLDAMIDMARPHVAVIPGQLDADPRLFNCENGTVDLRTGELREHRRSDLMTLIAPVKFEDYGEGGFAAACPIWSKFLARIFVRQFDIETDDPDGEEGADEDLIQYVQRLLGMCLTGDIRAQIMPIFYGGGANGKSVLLDTVCGLMGGYAGRAAPDLLTQTYGNRHPAELADLMGKRLVVASETEESAILRIQLVKQLTGDATIKARFMRQDYFEFDRTHKTVLVTNNKPRVNENTVAIWRRLKLVPFDVTIPDAEQDPELIAKLRDEWPGILAWMVRGCVEWQREGLAEPEAVKVATDEYRQDADPFLMFLNTECEQGAASEPEFTVSAKRLGDVYEKWCAENNEKPLATAAYGKRLHIVGCERGRVGQIRVWRGAKLKHETMTELKPDDQDDQDDQLSKKAAMFG